jgi:hypothetical protein
MLVVVDAGSISASAMTIPSALALLVNVFPDPLQQARAIGLFGGCGAVAGGEKTTYLIIYDGPHGAFT